ncbi:hypothetical protein MMC26_006183 [Xylographa opegraphella]|nr:hypothetical protein [Xylographa opegraphella]
MPDGAEEFMAVRELLPNRSNFNLYPETTLEVKIHRRLSSLSQDTESILQLKHVRRFPAQNKERLYLEWAPHGNLRVLIARYLRWRRYLPEPFLWYLFHKLAKASVILQYGRIDPPESVSDHVRKPEANKSSAPLTYKDMSQIEMVEACKAHGIRPQVKATKDDLMRLLQTHEASLGKSSGLGSNMDEAGKMRLELQTGNWKEIVHKDISPNNSKWSMYPMPKLADYGLAIEAPEGDVGNPGADDTPGVAMFMAPVYLPTPARDRTEVANPFARNSTERDLTRRDVVLISK